MCLGPSECLDLIVQYNLIAVIMVRLVKQMPLPLPSWFILITNQYISFSKTSGLLCLAFKILITSDKEVKRYIVEINGKWLFQPTCTQSSVNMILKLSLLHHMTESATSFRDVVFCHCHQYKQTIIAPSARNFS